MIAILGCSGSGKTALTNYLIENYKFKSPVHTTTRAHRDDDNGFYKYVSKQKFLKMHHNGEFFVASGDGKRYYGVEKKEIEKVKNETIIINISLKDLPYLYEFQDIFFIMIQPKFGVLSLFISGVKKRLEILEIAKRILIYYVDYFKYHKYIKETIDMKVIWNKFPKGK